MVGWVWLFGVETQFSVESNLDAQQERKADGKKKVRPVRVDPTRSKQKVHGMSASHDSNVTMTGIRT